MKLLAFTFATALCLLGGSLVAHAQTPSIAPIIAKEGVFAVSDGSSTFQLHKGGKFTMEPVGMSGRTVEGFWTQTDDSHFVITGKWGWVNGLSRNDDYRRMELYISYHGGDAKTLDRGVVRVHPAYVLIDALVKVDKAAFDKARAASAR